MVGAYGHIDMSGYTIDDDYPTMRCPKCGHNEEDMDGFGFLGPCPSCGYCRHPNSTMEGEKWICGVCGGEVKYGKHTD